MAFDPEFLELMPLSCTVKPPTGTNGYGEASGWGTPQTIRCHVQYQSKETNSTVGEVDGVTRLEEGIVYLAGSYAITTQWALAIPVPGGTRDVQIIAVEQNTDEESFHHTALHFGPI